MERDTARLFGIYVKEHRLAKEWTQDELARASGLGNYQAIMEIENGRAVPNINKAYAIAQALGVSLTQLTGESLPQATPTETRRMRHEADPWQLSFRVVALLNEIKGWDKQQREALMNVFNAAAHMLEIWPMEPSNVPHPSADLLRTTQELLLRHEPGERPEAASP